MDVPKFDIPLEFHKLDPIKGHDYNSYEVELASTVTQRSTVQGTFGTFYNLEPVTWAQKIFEVARDLMVMQPLAKQAVLQQGSSQLVWYKETYDPSDSESSEWETSSAEYTTANTDALSSDIANEDAVVFAPTNENYSITLTNDSLRTNGLNLVERKSKNLRDRLAYTTDNAAFTAIRPKSGGDVTEHTTSARGLQTIFGGDATTDDDTLAAGDVMGPSIIRKARRMLKSGVGHFWDSDVETKAASIAKNKWRDSKDGPLYGIISAYDTEQLTGDPQFTNAANFGNSSIIQSGFVASYVGIKFAESDLLKTFSDGDDAYVQADNTAINVDAHEMYFLKANYAFGLVWGLKPKMTVYDIPARFQKGIGIEQAYHILPIYDDAIVRVILADDLS